MKFINKKVTKAFTLAETLITLVIIGVVASLTIPALVNSYQQSVYNTGVQKAYSMLSQAIQKIQTNNGGVVNVGTDGTAAEAKVLRDDFCNVMNCMKTDSSTNIYSSISSPFYYSYYKGDYRTVWNLASDGNPVAILNNGNYLYFDSYANCTNGTGNACGLIYVDINGAQKPNMYGEDLFEFWIILNNGSYSILPMGTSGDGTSCTPGTGTYAISAGCAYKRLYNPSAMQ